MTVVADFNCPHAEAKLSSYINAKTFRRQSSTYSFYHLHSSQRFRMWRFWCGWFLAQWPAGSHPQFNQIHFVIGNFDVIARLFRKVTAANPCDSQIRAGQRHLTRIHFLLAFIADNHFHFSITDNARATTSNRANLAELIGLRVLLADNLIARRGDYLAFSLSSFLFGFRKLGR